MKLLILALSLLSFNAYATCQQSYVCYKGHCRYIDVCETTLDLPSTNVRPIESLPTLEIEPLPSLELPPIGTTSCQYMQVNGHWKNICY